MSSTTAAFDKHENDEEATDDDDDAGHDEADADGDEDGEDDEEFTQLVERTLQVELSPKELDGYWQDLCPGNGPQRISFEEWFGWVRRNYLPFQELTVDVPVPESYELITSAVGVALAIYVLGQFDAIASSFRGLSGTPLTLWAPPLGSVVVLLFGPGLQGRRGAISDTDAVRTVLVACIGCAFCAMLAIYSFGGDQPAITRAAAASGSLLWMRSTRSLFAPAGAFACLAVDQALPRLPPVRDWQWVAEGVQLIVVPAVVGSLFLFAAQSAAVFLRSKFAWQEALSIQDTWLVGELRSAFPSLPKRELSKLLREAEEVYYKPRSVLTDQGEVNPYIWLVVSGSLVVEVGGQVASTLERKAIIGEVTFLDPKDKLATATVYANTGGARTLRWSQVQAAQADGVDYAPDGKAHRPVLPVCADVVAEVRGFAWSALGRRGGFRPPRVQIVQMLKDEIGRRDEEALQFAREWVQQNKADAQTKDSALHFVKFASMEISLKTEAERAAEAEKAKFASMEISLKTEAERAAEAEKADRQNLQDNLLQAEIKSVWPQVEQHACFDSFGH
ncbi:hypothetical protein AK812_SmicGene34629 [Symbiodinium microadriaticum]|uniref:Cyclic nucleotide-binding domain-containing protein n=1 Tax=Symbiodinium microadriaticum TaxID=2951 RepID=A0A1Q9CNI9_SYMMI|nr:hypothetical protein AK812_SmicGene34629 [Symbiodinium microadriaticum]